jgi:hypothetical protein
VRGDRSRHPGSESPPTGRPTSFLVGAGRPAFVAATGLGLGLSLGAATCTRDLPRRVPLSLPGNGAFTMPDRAVCDDERAAPIDSAAIDIEAAPALRELSGLAASYENPSVLWAVADRGNAPVVFGLDADDGRLVITVTLPVDNIDWEDVAVGPCPDLSGPCVFVADTGDNDGERDAVVVHAFPEPMLAVTSLATTTTGSPATVTSSRTTARVTLDAVWTMPLSFPDDARGVDVEALVVLPDATALLLFEKTGAEVARIFAYRAPWTPLSPDDLSVPSPRLLEKVGTVAVPSTGFGDAGSHDDEDRARARRITGASLHWSGRRLLLRTTAGVLEYDADDPARFFDLTGRAPRVAWPGPADEEQGEAVAFDAVGTAVWTASETKDDVAPVLHKAACAGAVTPPIRDVAPVMMTTVPSPSPAAR